MTGIEWIDCADPLLMLECFRDEGCNRKLRLFACGWCRCNWHLFIEKKNQKAIEVSERFAEGVISRQALSGARRDAHGIWAKRATEDKAWDAAAWTAELNAFRLGHARDANQMKAQCDLLRCIFGNPFNPVAITAIWLVWNDGTVPKIAEAIYAERAFDRMPILADALEDAGCDNADILAHCRSEGPHARGCWVIDLILGKQ